MAPQSPERQIDALSHLTSSHPSQGQGPNKGEDVLSVNLLKHISNKLSGAQNVDRQTGFTQAQTKVQVNRNGRSLTTSATQPNLTMGMMSPINGSDPSDSDSTLDTPHRLGRSGTGLTATEPRNYAPRTAGIPVSDSAPPRFGLDAIRDESPRDTPGHAQVAASDPFAPNIASNTAMVLSPSQAIMPMSNQAGFDQIPLSDKLGILLNTPSGIPNFSMAMGPAYFPFFETARQATPVNHGVVRLQNVSPESCPSPFR